jgi:putative ABC transport system permease protein
MLFITFILRNLTRRPTRSILTILGLTVAVASMIALLGITSNLLESVQSSFENRGIDLIVQQAGKSSGLNSDFREYLVNEAKKIPGVKQVDFAVVNLIDMTKENGNSEQVMIQGWRPDNFAFEENCVAEGRKLEKGDRHVVILGKTLADNLNKKVGDTIVFGRRDSSNNENVYEVIGILKNNVVFDEGSAIVSLEDGRKLTGIQVTAFSVRIAKTSLESSDAEVDAVRKRIEALRDPEDTSVRLVARTPAEYVSSLSHLRMIRAISWLISAIAVVIGVIGLLNTMAMSVLERTQEIGILRAVGWPPFRVVSMVLGEATLLSLSAAAFGTLFAAVGMYLLTLSPKVNGFIESGLSPMVVAEGFAVTLMIGLLGGLYPAIRAARLLPTEAIRHD